MWFGLGQWVFSVVFLRGLFGSFTQFSHDIILKRHIEQDHTLSFFHRLLSQNFQIETDDAATNLLQELDAASDKAVKATKILAKSAIKKGVKNQGQIEGTTTRAATKLKPVDPAMAKFTLRNFGLAKSEDEMKFQLQELVTLVASQFDKNEMNMHQKGMMTAFMLKEFQRYGVFCNCDHVIYHAQGNTVSHMNPH